MTRFLVTGATGYIGSRIVRRSILEGHAVRAVTRRDTLPESLTGAEYAHADIGSLTRRDADRLVEGIDTVIHCAGQTSNTSQMRAVHVDGSRVLAAAAACRVTRWVQLSSAGALGRHCNGTVSETDRTSTSGLYETTKDEADAAITEELQDSSTSLALIMPTIVFGPDMVNGSLRLLVDLVRRGLFVHGLGAVANYVHVDDVIEAVMLASTSSATGPFIVADSTSMAEFVGSVRACSGQRPVRRTLPGALFGIMTAVAGVAGRREQVTSRVHAVTSRASYSAARARAELRWRPRVGWRAGIEQCVDTWHSRDPVASPRFTVAHVTTVPVTLNFLRGHISHQQQLGWDVLVISSRNGTELAAYSSANAVRYRAVEMTRGMAPVRDMVSLIRLCQAIRTERPDVVHAYTPKAGLLAAIAARLNNVDTVVVSLFGLPQMLLQGPRKALLDMSTRISTRLARAVWCDSESMARHVVQEGLASPAKIVVLGAGSVGGVDPDEFNAAGWADARSQIRAELGVADSDLVVGYVGRVNRDKGMDELSRSWKRLCVDRPATHLLIVGPLEGELPPGVLSVLTADRRAHWVGPQQRVAPWLAAMDVFVMPSYREGFCVTNIEAAAMGLPVVATRIPGCVDSVLDQVTGTLVPVHDADALSAALIRYLDDPALGDAHGEAGRARTGRCFPPSLLCTGLSDLYLRLVAGNPVTTGASLRTDR